MPVRCVVCGVREELPIWTAMAERCTVHPELQGTYVCPRCDTRCPREACATTRDSWR